jgi:tetraacyldisaccharide 4'-kinase
MTRAALSAGAALYGAAWELRRRLYARGLKTQCRVAARVVSVGNLTVGGTGKTTLSLHLARAARARGLDVAVVCRRYRPGPEGEADEERLYAQAIGADRVYAGTRKRALAQRAAAAGRELVIVDDGFSHWPLARDVDVVLLDSTDLWGGGALLPAGRLREPHRALQRARVIVVSRLEPDADADALLEEVGRHAPAAHRAAGRHRLVAVRTHDGRPSTATGPAVVVTATGNPRAVARTARAAGYDPVRLSAYRDHHWFTTEEARREGANAAARGETLVLTAKDAVRWPIADDPCAAVIEVEWEWVRGGEQAERLALEGEEGARWMPTS